MALTEVVANTGFTTVPVETTPLAVPRPPATQVVAEEHETVWSVVTPCTGVGVPGAPPVIGTTTPWPPPTPTASQLVDVAHETERSDFVPLTTCGAPGDPLVMVTTTPAPLRAFEPTASHRVAVGHEIEVSWSTPVALCREVTLAAVDEDEDEVEVEEEEDGEELPHAARDAANANMSTTNDLRTTSPRWIAGRTEGAKRETRQNGEELPGASRPQGAHAAATETP
jgi:hypothetical protein